MNYRAPAKLPRQPHSPHFNQHNNCMRQWMHAKGRQSLFLVYFPYARPEMSTSRHRKTPLSDPSLWHLPDPTFITSCTNFPGAKTLFKLLKNKHVRVGNGNAPELGAESRDRRQLSCWEGSGGLKWGSGGS